MRFLWHVHDDGSQLELDKEESKKVRHIGG